MNTTEVKILLDKYYDGETSLDEEKFLKAYFESEQVDPSLREHAAMFSFIRSEAGVKAGDGLEEKITDGLSASTSIPFYRHGRFWVYVSGIAASILFLLTLVFETRINQDHKDTLDGTAYTREDARKAYDQTRIALAYVSEKYVAGTEPLGEISKFKNTALTMTELARFSKQIDNVENHVDKMDKGIDDLSKLSKITIIVKP